MLGLVAYLTGVVEVLALGAFAWLGGLAARRRMAPGLGGLPAHLATAVVALAILLWGAELLGAFGLWKPFPYLALVAVVGAGAWMLLGGRAGSGASPHRSDGEQAGGEEKARLDGGDGRLSYLTIVALAIAAVALFHFADGVRLRLDTGMTGFDSTWYHGPFAAGFLQSGSTWDLHFIAPQFLAWFYPANAEIFHGAGMLAFDRDILSPLLNLGWFVGCLAAAWCIGRPFGVAPFSLSFAAIALSVPALADQAGEARNDLAGIFFLLAAVAIALNASASRAKGKEALLPGALALVGLSAGLAAGTKLNFLLPAAVLVLGLSLVAPRGKRWRSFAIGGLAALAGGGYWYLRNLVHAGNPLPWVDGLGPVSLPAPVQALGGREAHSVFGYLADGAAWSDWFLPGLRDGFWIVWPLLGALAVAGLLLCLGRRGDRVLRVAGLAGLAAALAWLVAPTSASGPDGMPRGFESGLRYLAPALVLGLALLPVTPALRARLASLALKAGLFPHAGNKSAFNRALRSRRLPVGLGIGLVAFVVALGYPVQRHYLESRYADPGFTTPGLNAAFKWARSVSDSRVATTSTRQYPLFGTDLSNRVEYVGEERPHGGFVAPSTCTAWRRLLNEGDYDYVLASRDRIQPGRPAFPETARWTAGPDTKVILREPPTIVFELTAPLPPSGCPRDIASDR